MKVINDNGCTWIKQLTARDNVKSLRHDLHCDYLIIGAGYTGLSAARKLSEISKNKKIIVVDAQLAGVWTGTGFDVGCFVGTQCNRGGNAGTAFAFGRKKILELTSTKGLPQSPFHRNLGSFP